MLVAARLAQGLGAAMMLPAALSILTTTFKEGSDRNTALGVWGAMGGLASAAGVLLGGLLTEGPGWRWVMFVNPLAALLVLGGIFRLISGERRRARLADFDLRGAILATGGMLLLVFALVKAPDQGWGAAARSPSSPERSRCWPRSSSTSSATRNPLLPLSIFRVKGLAAADATQLVAFAGLARDVLLPHPLHAERPRLLADPDRRRLPPAHLRRRHRRRHLLAAAAAHRDPTGDRRSAR